jgi:hypothetical protein
MSDDDDGLCPWPCWCPWRARPVNVKRNSGWWCPWPRRGANARGDVSADWLDDDELDAAQVRHVAATGDEDEGVWLLRRMFGHIITGSPASEPLRRYAEELDASLSRARNDHDRLKALNLASHNPPNNPPRTDDENLRRQAATAAAVIILTRNRQMKGEPFKKVKGEVLAQLGERCGADPKTLYRYLKAFGDENYKDFDRRESAELRALADQFYAIPLAAILSRKSQ